MSNVTVQEALKAAQKVICEGIYSDDGMDGEDGQKALLAIDAALAEIDKCEPVAEAIRERDRLGFAVVNVIGKLDEIIENTQEVEVDDFLHIAVPVDMWNELQAALEDMPKRADLYTAPQPIEKCEPVGEVFNEDKLYCYMVDTDIEFPNGTKLYTAPQPIEKCEPVGWYCKACKETGLSHCSDPENCGGMVRTYTSPISKEWVVIDEKTIDDIGNTLSDEQGFIPVETWTEFARAIEAKLKQLNVLEKG